MATLKYKNPATGAWETLDALPAIGQAVEITATELTGKSTADRAAMYAAGTRLLKVVNGDTEVLLGLDADGSTEWLGSNKPLNNLLDNSDFTNPVNQRGATIVTDGYSIDRWRNWAANSSSITVNNNSISVVGTLLQYVANIKPGSVLTFAYGNESKTVISSNWGINTENNVAYFNIETGTWTWAAVYMGAYTADTLPPYTPKGYAAEFAECQRYYKHFINNAFLGTAIVSSDGTLLQGFIPLETPMRINNPAINGTLAFYETTQNQTLGTPTLFIQQGNGIRCNWNLTTSLTVKSTGFINALNEVGISADL